MGLRGPAPKAKPVTTIKFDPGVPDAPAWLDANGKKEYARAADLLQRADGALQQVDMAVLAMYAQAYADVCRFTKKLRGKEVVKTPQGYVANPLRHHLSNAQQKLLAAAQKLGFSPADRQRVSKSGATGKAENPFMQHIGTGNGAKKDEASE